MENLNELETKIIEKSREVSLSEPYDVAITFLYLKRIGMDKMVFDIRKAFELVRDEWLKTYIANYIDKMVAVFDKEFFTLNLSDKDIKEISQKIQDRVVLYSYGRSENITPDSVIRLAEKILEVGNKDRVLDLCSGYAEFLNSVTGLKEISLTGVEINTNAVAISKMRAFINNQEYKIIQSDAFEFAGGCYNKIFSNFPFGMSVRFVPTAGDIVNELKTKSYGNLVSADWAFIYKITQLLDEKGRAVVVVPNGPLVNSSEKQVREFFLKSNLIDAVITLPEKIFTNTAVQTNVIVLSNGWKEGVRFVDARKCVTKGRRSNIFSEENINEILKMLKSDSENSKFIELSKIFKEGSVLVPERFLREKTKLVENGIEFGEVIKFITRGAPIAGIDLDKNMSSEETDFCYLTLSNIKDGMIDEKLPFLKEFNEKNSKYCIKNRNIVMSKNGYPFKVAVVDRKDNKQVMANGNLFIIEIDEEKANPYYIKAFFDSEIGISTLKSIMVGSTIPNIGLEALKHVKIPNISLEEQEEIANKYLAKRDEIDYLKRQLAKAIDSLNHIVE